MPSTSKPGSVRGTEPGASTTASPVSSTSPEPPPETVTRLPAWRRPWPSSTVTLRLLSSEPRPEMSPSTILSLRASEVGPVDRRLAGVDAVLRRLVDVEVGGRRLEQLLGRDAPDVEAGAAEPALLDHGDVQPGRRPVEGGGVATGTTPDDDDVVVISRGDHLRVARVGGRAETRSDSTGRIRCAPIRPAPRSASLLLLGLHLVDGRGVAAHLDDGVGARAAAAGVDAAHRRHVVVVATVADGDVALARPAARWWGRGPASPSRGWPPRTRRGSAPAPRRRRRRRRWRRSWRRSSPTRSGRGCRRSGTAPRRGGRSPGTRPCAWASTSLTSTPM